MNEDWKVSKDTVNRIIEETYILGRKNKHIIKKDLEDLISLENKIEKAAINLLKWYDKKVSKVGDVDRLDFNGIDDRTIWYKGYSCQEPFTFTLETELLFLNDNERIEYVKQFKEELEKQRLFKIEEEKQKKEQDAINNERYEKEELKRLKEKYES